MIPEIGRKSSAKRHEKKKKRKKADWAWPFKYVSGSTGGHLTTKLEASRLYARQISSFSAGGVYWSDLCVNLHPAGRLRDADSQRSSSSCWSVSGCSYMFIKSEASGRWLRSPRTATLMAAAEKLISDTDFDLRSKWKCSADQCQVSPPLTSSLTSVKMVISRPAALDRVTSSPLSVNYFLIFWHFDRSRCAFQAAIDDF